MLVLRAGGFPSGTKPNINSMTILIGDAMEQLEHFDVLFLRQIIMLLSPGLSTLALPVLPRKFCDSSDEAMRIISTTCNETVPDFTRRQENPISRFESLTYLSNAACLLTSTHASASREDLKYRHLIDGLCAAGTTGIIQCSVCHKGPGPFKDETGKPMLRDSDRFRELEVKGYEGVPAAVAHVQNPLRQSPPRMTLFCTVDPSPAEVMPDQPKLYRKGDTYSEQHREEVVLDNLRLYDSLPACYIRCFERGYTVMPRFLFLADRRRYRLTHALLKAWRLSKDPANAAEGKRNIVLISAAFRAVFAGEEAATQNAVEGLDLLDRLCPPEGCSDEPYSDSD